MAHPASSGVHRLVSLPKETRALLLRASACRLAEAGKYVTDPASADAVRLLTKEQSFKGLRVQGVRSDLEMEVLFGSKPSLVAATMHAELGKALAALGERATAIGEWARTAQCPLPRASPRGGSSPRS